MAQKTGTMPALSDDHHSNQPGTREYIGIAVFLTIITGLEVAIYYIDAFSSFLVEALIVLSVIKFGVIVAYFMHLKFDSKILTQVFVSALLVSMAVFVAAWYMMHEMHATEIFVGGR